MGSVERNCIVYLEDMIQLISKYISVLEKLKFDLRGNLKPYERCSITIEEFERFFVTNFNESVSRRMIYESYINYVIELKETIDIDITQWINGSFVTRKMNPNDIDIVSFIDYNCYREKQKIIEDKFGKFGDKYLFPFVDAYIVKNFPAHHENYWITKHDRVYWSNWFSETKLNRADKTFPKGYIEITYT